MLRFLIAEIPDVVFDANDIASLYVKPVNERSLFISQFGFVNLEIKSMSQMKV